MASLAGFDASQVPEQESFPVIPEGPVVAIATASEMKPTKKGDGAYLQFVFEVLDPPPYKGRKVFSRMNLQNANAQTVEIARRELAAFCRAVGINQPQDSAELHNKPVRLQLGIEQDERRRENNVIKKYESVNAPAGGAPAPAAAPAAPAWQQPAAAAPAQQAWAAPAAAHAAQAPAPAPAPAAAPWGAAAAPAAAPWGAAGR